MDSKLQIAERHVGDVAILTLSGQMLLDDGDLLFHRHISDLTKRGVTKVIVDLAAVSYIDSSGIGMMAAKLKHLRERGGDMRLVNLSARSQRIFGMMKLMIAFEAFDDEATALRSFAARPTL